MSKWVVLYHDQRKPTEIEGDKRAMELAEAREKGEFIKFEGGFLDTRKISEIVPKEDFDKRSSGAGTPPASEEYWKSVGSGMDQDKIDYIMLFRTMVGAGLKYRERARLMKKGKPQDLAVAKQIKERIGKLKPEHQKLIYGHSENPNTKKEHVII